MKQTTELLRVVLAEYCAADRSFSVYLHDKQRAFNCAPLDDQLRGYVYTDALTDQTVLSIVVQGE